MALFVCICAHMSDGNELLLRPDGNRMHKIFLRSLLQNQIFIKQTLTRATDSKEQFRDVGIWPYGSFLAYKPNFLPISYYGKRDGESNIHPDNFENEKVEYVKRSVESLVSRDTQEYDNLMKAIKALQAEKGSDLNDIIRQYDDGLQQVIELLLPPLSPDKMESIKSLLNAMIKRRFGSWGGRKRSEFYSWGGRRKRDKTESESEVNQSLKSNQPFYINKLAETKGVDPKIALRNDGANRHTIYKDKNMDMQSTTVKRNDFYPWGGKRTLPPVLPYD